MKGKVDIWAMTFWWSYMIILGVPELETENKRKCQASGLRVISVTWEIQAVVAYDRVFETVWSDKQNSNLESGLLWEVVAYKRVDCTD